MYHSVHKCIMPYSGLHTVPHRRMHTRRNKNKRKTTSGAHKNANKNYNTFCLLLSGGKHSGAKANWCIWLMVSFSWFHERLDFFGPEVNWAKQDLEQVERTLPSDLGCKNYIPWPSLLHSIGQSTAWDLCCLLRISMQPRNTWAIASRSDGPRNKIVRFSRSFEGPWIYCQYHASVCAVTTVTLVNRLPLVLLSFSWGYIKYKLRLVKILKTEDEILQVPSWPLKPIKLQWTFSGKRHHEIDIALVTFFFRKQLDAQVDANR